MIKRQAQRLARAAWLRLQLAGNLIALWCVEQELQLWINSREAIPRGGMFAHYMREHDRLSGVVTRLRLQVESGS